jgi:hypothetical protein
MRHELGLPAAAILDSSGTTKMLAAMSMAVIALLSLGCAVLAADPEPAGVTELQGVEAKIRELAAMMQETRLQLDLNHRQSLDMLAAEARQRADGWRPYPGSAPASIDELRAYTLALQRDRGFDPLAPSSVFQHHWQEVRRQEHRLFDEYAGLVDALHHLESLRDRIRHQLGMAPQP